MKKSILYTTLVGVVVVFVTGVFLFKTNENSRERVHIDPETLYPVTTVLDGDTFKVIVDKKVITVRLLGIDTPETVDPRKPAQCFGKEASEETKKLLLGQQVYVKLNPKREVTDKYGRYLVYVYRQDGLFVNEYLLQQGFAREYTYGSPYSFQKEFKQVQQESMNAKHGLWARCM
jgi:micrococcal nuclease